MSESKFYHFSATGLFYCVGSLQDAIAASEEGGFIWLNYFQPSKEELNLLISAIGIHPLSIEDCLDDRQVPKIEHFPNSTFIIFNAFSYVEDALVIDEVNLFLGKNFVITISGHNSGTRRPLNDIAGLVENSSSNSKSSPAFIMHVVLDYLVDQKYKAIDDMDAELEAAEEELLENVETFQPVRLIRLRKDLLIIRKSLFNEREILVKICRHDCPFVPDNAIVRYRDIYDHLTKFFELTETYREIETSLMELYTSLLNNLMTKMSNDTNSSVRRLTLMATIFMPLTLIASIGGMSEWSMMTGPDKWRISYPLFLLGMLIIGILVYYSIRRLEKKGKLFKGL
jgi:magnesium transporter